MVPSPSKHDGENFDENLSGNIFGSAVLHHTGKPSSSPPIAPVTYIAGTAFRQLWVCIHAAALTEACEALTYACASQGSCNELFFMFDLLDDSWKDRIFGSSLAVLSWTILFAQRVVLRK
ncbi:hypothetical protein F511_16333 [Dorcoceras hygrometricum]|uniref:Uncharacterized protein n=1 Tax=Dorcoceras hygrometricum TaxID=472368 RepID=A0A2Z7BX48_9LAMI|nr:hypothetical protein F511_16333 [Dorcoceras hygrometricum]